MIAGRTPRLPARMMAAAEDAVRAITRFDAEFGGGLAPFAPLLLRSESASSSQIENLTASARAVLNAEMGDRSTANANIIARNTSAMRAALRLSGDLGPPTILAMHAELLAEQPRHTPGEWRTGPVWIGTSNLTPVGAEYVAPAAARIPDLIDDLAAFSTRDDLPLLPQLAIAQAQFETVHPFSDGNGRTGRAYLQSMMRNKGLTRAVTLPVSAGLLTEVDAYHEALTAYREGDLEPIIELTTRATFHAVDNGTHLANDVEKIRRDWDALLPTRPNDRLREVMDLLIRQPVLNTAVIQEELGIRPANVGRHLSRLEDAGVIAGKNLHLKGKLWRAPKVLEALNQFAARNGRR